MQAAHCISPGDWHVACARWRKGGVVNYSVAPQSITFCLNTLSHNGSADAEHISHEWSQEINYIEALCMQYANIHLGSYKKFYSFAFAHTICGGVHAQGKKRDHIGFASKLGMVRRRPRPDFLLFQGRTTHRPVDLFKIPAASRAVRSSTIQSRVSSFTFTLFAIQVVLHNFFATEVMLRKIFAHIVAPSCCHCNSSCFRNMSDVAKS